MDDLASSRVEGLHHEVVAGFELVVDAGFSATHCVPIFGGSPLNFATKRCVSHSGRVHAAARLRSGSNQGGVCMAGLTWAASC